MTAPTTRWARWRPTLCAPPVTATAVAVALCIAYLLAPLMGGDLSAQLARADFAGAHPLAPVDLRWFGGTQPFGYSIWVPALMALITPRILGAIAAVVSTWLTTRLIQRAGAARPVVGGIAAAVCQASNLAEGRVAFAAGLAFGLAALDLLTSSYRLRRPFAIGAAFLAGAANPVAALLLWVCALVALVRRRVRDAAVLVIASAVPVAVIAGVFADGGSQLFNTTDAIRAALASLLVAVVVPTRYQPVRLGALIGLVMVAAAYFLPTPVGGNAIRLTLLFAVPVVAAFVDWRWWLAALTIVLAVVVQTPVTLGTLTGAGSPATRASYYAPLLAEIKAQGPLTGRGRGTGRERALGVGLCRPAGAAGPRVAAPTRHEVERRRLLQTQTDRGDLPTVPERQCGRVRRGPRRPAHLLRQA